MAERPDRRRRGSSGGPSGGLDPPDLADRQRIVGDLESTLFVEAGAGSGKTTALVERVLALVTGGHAEMREVAAITFTEKAAAELRDRIRRELVRCAEAERGTPRGRRAEAALEQLDGAAVGTLHAFAQRLLTEHPVEAGLPPRVEVLDEVSSAVAFEQRWTAFRDELLGDPTMERTLLLLFAAGVRPEALRSLAQAFDDNWDLVEQQVPPDAPEPAPVLDLLVDALQAVRQVCATPCRDPGDRLRQRLDEIGDRLEELAALEDEVAVVEALGPDGSPKLPSFRVGGLGRRGAFDDVDAVRAQVQEAGRLLDAVREEIARAGARRVGSAVRRFTLDSARQRQHAGKLQFHDLLVFARALLRHPEHGPSVRTRLHQRYRRLLLDEFQDTDPIQVELAVRISSSEPAAAATGRQPWDQVAVAPGRLFVVGDPKQSIYRFRRADIGTYLAAERRFGGDRLVRLTANFRTTEPIVGWANVTFGALMGTPGGDRGGGVRPTFRALAATRSGAPSGPPVAVTGRGEHPKGTPADQVRAAEAAGVAAAVAQVVREGWAVDDGAGGWRPSRLGDIAVLVPARTSLPFLEDALEDVGVPFRAEASSLVYASRAVRDLLMVVRAVDDPTNPLFVLSALRTPLLGCGDDDLFRFRHERGGRWGYLADQPPTVPRDDPVQVGLAYLRSLHEQRHWLAPSELLDRVARDRRAFELGTFEGRPRDVWRQLRFVVDQARSWSESTGGNLRQYLAWVGQQAAEGARVAEAVLPESDDDAVRVMTVHSAKGLEFPVVVVSGMSTAPTNRRAPAEVVFPPSGDVGYRFGRHVVTEEYSSWEPIDEQMSFDERVRLLYVACTRARDHLVVSVHRRTRSSAAEPTARTNAELLVGGMGHLLDALPETEEPSRGHRAGPVALPSAEPPLPYEAWREERDSSMATASLPTAVAATALTEEGTFDPGAEPDPGLQKRPRDLDLPPWLKGRYGTAVGRAVHGALQTVDLTTGADLDAVVAAQCEAEAVVERGGEVRPLVAAALASASVRAAAGRPHWREVYVCTPVGGRLLEGYVDLLYRGPSGLVVVDYKTSGSADPAELHRRVEGYRNQGASYALAVAAATGEAVERVTFLFLTPGGAFERDLPDLDRAVERVRQLVLAGGEIVVG